MSDADSVSPSDMRRFVVLRHAQGLTHHFDLMVEEGDGLATWKLADAPETAASRALACQRIADHRRLYLEYEGLISGNRGEVKRHDEGRCLVQVDGTAHWEIDFHGKRITGQFELVQSSDSSKPDHWLLRSRSE
ncbi:MAG TPA: DNA polymerase ligase N-terminal domain-containing protein [Phycisphaerae bacterium]|nr:DNA polymerase ligase N-terminal domain-containing protein [Phycisphaerae bacterium]